MRDTPTNLYYLRSSSSRIVTVITSWPSAMAVLKSAFSGRYGRGLPLRSTYVPLHLQVPLGGGNGSGVKGCNFIVNCSLPSNSLSSSV